MKIGILSFEVSPAGLNQLLEKVVIQFEKKHTVKGVKLKGASEVLQYINFETENTLEASLPHKRLVPPSPLRLSLENYRELDQFDAVIIAGPNQTFQLVEELNRKLPATAFLFVPVSIYNDIDESELSLGYDTAVNYIVDSILKVRDTIDSLKYPEPRLFGVQLTGQASGKMLKEVGLAAESHVIFNKWDGFDASELNSSLEKEFAAGHTHSFVIFDSSIEPESVPEVVLPSIAVRWQMIQIDEALCMGPNPTALDRLIAMQFAEKIADWIEGERASGKLLIKNRKTIFERL